jgi:hypothetical protein
MAYCSLEEFKTLVREGSWAYLNERRAFKTKEKLGWSDNDVAEMLLGLNGQKDFQKSVSNRRVNDFPGHEFIDADQYEIHWHVEERVGKSGPMPGTISLSLKISVAADADGRFAGLVTFHISGSP